MAKLKTKYDSSDDIDEKYRDLFEEKDGKWLLVGVEGANDADAVARMGKQRDEARKQVAELQGKLKAFDALGDRDPSEVVKLVEEVEDLRSQLEEAKQVGGKSEEALQKRVDAAIVRAEAKWKREVDKAVGEHDKTRKLLAEEQGRVVQLDGRIKSSAIRDALVKAATEGASKVKPTAIPDVLMYAGNFELTDDGKVVTRDGVGVTPGLAPGDWLADRKADRSHWWDESVGGGAKGNNGAKGAGGPNPFAKGQANITAAAKVIREDPARAQALASAAGYGSVDAAIKAMGRS